MAHKDREKRLSYLAEYRAKNRPAPTVEAQPNGLPALGAIEYNDEGTHVRCHVCGRWYKALNGHFRMHDLNEATYKERYGLKRTASLLPPATAAKYREVTTARGQGEIGKLYLPKGSRRPVGLAPRLQNKIEASAARVGLKLRSGEKVKG